MRTMSLAVFATLSTLVCAGVAFGQAPPVGPGHCVANCGGGGFRGGGGGGGGGGGNAGAIGSAIGMGLSIGSALMQQQQQTNRYRPSSSEEPSRLGKLRKFQQKTKPSDSDDAGTTKPSEPQQASKNTPSAPQNASNSESGTPATQFVPPDTRFQSEVDAARTVPGPDLAAPVQSAIQDAIQSVRDRIQGNDRAQPGPL